MDTIDAADGRRRRRKHSPEFKARVIAACRKPGVSMAAVALAHKLNANLVRTWVVAAERARSRKPVRGSPSLTTLPVPVPTPPPADAFIPLPLAVRPTVSGPDANITIELRRGTTTIKLAWPVSAAAECAAWLKDLLR